MTTWERFLGRALDGRFHPLDPHRLKQTLQGWNERQLEVAVRLARKKRTLDQNAMIHVLAEQIAELSGATLLEVKRLATLDALGAEEGIERYTALGQNFIEVRGTSTLSTGECSKVVDVLIRQAEFLGITPRNADSVEVM